MARIALPTILASGLLLASLAPASGCLFGGYEGVYFEEEDVRIDLPAAGFRADVEGDATRLINQTATDVNGWVTVVVEVTGYVVEFLNNHHPSSLDGEWRVYGPFDDSSDRDLAWLVRVAGTEADTTFEFMVAPLGTTDPAEFDLLSEGNLTVEDDLRFGTLHIDFDTVQAYPELNLTLLWDFAGDITINFERDVASGDKSINLDFDAFEANRTGYLEDDHFNSSETYEYQMAGDGSGSFHLALMGEWDTYPYGWSGPEQERMQLDMVWTQTGEGRALGTITEVDGVGDMKYGDLSLDECFDASNFLSYRFLTEAYANEIPDYNFGTTDTCVVELP